MKLGRKPKAPAFEGFVEYEPSNGKNAPASLRTSARLPIDDQALVFGIRAWDASPASMQGSLARRDKVGTEQDFIGIWIDPTGQGRPGPSFTAVAPPVASRARVLAGLVKRPFAQSGRAREGPDGQISVGDIEK